MEANISVLISNFSILVGEEEHEMTDQWKRRLEATYLELLAMGEMEESSPSETSS